MNTTDLVQFFSADTSRQQAAARPSLAPSRHELAGAVRSSIFHGRTELIAAQRVDGSWADRARGDAASFALFVLLDAYLDRETSEVAELAVTSLLREQLPEGGWSNERGGAFDLDTSVLAYFALKLVGENPCRPELAHARHAIRTHGGADACSAATRLWFALLGQIGYEACPPVAPEWLLMPGYTDKHTASEIYSLATRAVIWALRPTRDVALTRGIRELFIEQSKTWRTPTGSAARLPWWAFLGFWKGCERIGWLPLRRRALERADFLLTEATVGSAAVEVHGDELVLRRIALEALGHGSDSRVMVEYQRLLERFSSDKPDEARSRPHTSLTSDTALAIEALRTSGVGVNDDPIVAATNWLITHRLISNRPPKHPSEIAAIIQVCSCLQDADESNASMLPPDIKLAGEQRSASQEHDRQPASELEKFSDQLLDKVVTWQQADGGWTLSDDLSVRRCMFGVLRASDRRTQQASDADATGMMLELLARLPVAVANSQTTITRGVAFLQSCQRGDGSWLSTNGYSSIVATAWAVRGLIAAGVEPSDESVAAGVNWLLIHQQVSGEWRDSGTQPATDDDFVPETAAAILALVRTGLADDEATRRGIDALVDSDAQNARDLRATSWKVIALSQWNVAVARQSDDGEAATLRLACGDTTS